LKQLQYLFSEETLSLLTYRVRSLKSLKK